MRMFEPEDFLETLDRMIDLNTELLDAVGNDEISDEIVEDLARLRDLHHRICLQFEIESIIWN